MNKFTFNQEVIWDSGFGYDIGLWLGEDKNQYYHDIIDLRTGIIYEPTSLLKSEIKPYSEELIKELTEKYGYEKKFSTIF